MASMLSATLGFVQLSHADIIVGSDLNSSNGANAVINSLYSGNRGSNGGGDQSLQFGAIFKEYPF